MRNDEVLCGMSGGAYEKEPVPPVSSYLSASCPSFFRIFLRSTTLLRPKSASLAIRLPGIGAAGRRGQALSPSHRPFPQTLPTVKGLKTQGGRLTVEEDVLWLEVPVYDLWMARVEVSEPPQHLNGPVEPLRSASSNTSFSA